MRGIINFIIILIVFTKTLHAYELDEITTLSNEQVSITGAVIKNKNDNKIFAYLGIPFAKPPVGELRWKAPRDTEFQGQLSANINPNRCVQISNFYDSIDGISGGEIIGEEDCLYLNIYISEKALKSKKKLPVMFWIHGGGNTWGYSASNLFVSGDFVLDHEIVLVTTNYRLGPFGWFKHDGLNYNSDNDLDKSANFGTLDLVKSLEWVRKHIGLFNGDEKNITIFGESAGGRNVISLMSAPQSKNLFERGIAQSGYLGSDTLDFAINDERSGSKGFLIAKLKEKTNLTDEEINKKILDKNFVNEFLLNLTSDEIIRYYRVDEDTEGLIDVPNVLPDDIVIPNKGIYGVFRDGEMHDKPMIFGTTRDEDKLFMFMNDTFVKRPLNFLSWISNDLSFIVTPKDRNYYDIYAKYMALSWRHGAVVLPSRFMSNNKLSKVYAYRFDWDEQPSYFGIDLPVLLGAAHAMEIPFVFKNASLLGESDDYISSIMYDKDNRQVDLALSDEIGEYWVNFAYDGNPNKFPYDKSTKWLNWDSKNDIERFIVLDTSNDKGIAMFNNTDSADSILQGLASENIKLSEKCYVIDKMFARTTLTSDEVDDIYESFMNGKCLR